MQFYRLLIESIRLRLRRRRFPAFVAAFVLSAGAAQAADPERPNIVIMLADDMGYSDIGCYGSEIATPNLDRLAAGGLRFTQFYNTARCNPTRAALLTGLNPQQSGMAWIPEDLGLPAYLGHLNDRCVTIAEVLRDAGYTTLLSGKWHVGSKRPHWPVDRGFDRAFGLIGGAGSYWERLPGPEHLFALDDEEWTPPDDGSFYFTDAITDRAMEFVGEVAGEQPFFLYLAYTAPHWPLHAPEEDIARYRGRYREGWDKLREERYRRQIELGLIDPRWELSPRDSSVPAWHDVPAAERNLWDLRMAVHAAMVDRMDKNIGRFLARLETLGERENTVVIFLSDNGGCSIDPPRDHAGSDPDILPGPKGGYWGYGAEWANVSDTPFRKFKQFIHEGGIATPMIVNWPAGLREPGRLDHRPAHVIDLMPTALDLAGAVYPKTYDGRDIEACEGLSIAPALWADARLEHDILLWEHTGNQGVRMGDWKLVATKNALKGWELYNLAEDRTELHDLAAAEPERVREMRARFDAWFDDLGLLEFEAAKRLRDQKRRERRDQAETRREGE